MSGVGKGITTSSIGKLLVAKGLRVNPIKIDPYLNVDAGTMNPTEHGEVFVLDSGLETDQDMGNYERFLEMDLAPEDYMTSGLIYKTVIDRERNLGYKGKCVEAIPHITQEITKRILASAEKNQSDITLVEIGGTIGDFQNAMFIEAARILKLKRPRDVIFMLVSYLPVPSKIGEMKTKPTQTAVRMLNANGIQPDFLIARSAVPLDHKRKEKLSISCNVFEHRVISAPDIESIYDVPLNFEKDKLADAIFEALNIKKRKTGGLEQWKKFVSKSKHPKKQLNVAVVGKYFETGDFVLSDAYVSVIEAIKFSAFHQNAKANLHWLDSVEFEKHPSKVRELSQYDGVIVPGGFGERGIEGNINVIRYCRENKIPYFGLCYGMQLMVIEYARHKTNLTNAHTAEINPEAKHVVIDIMPDQKKHLAMGNYGASMRLGAYPAYLKKGTVARAAYGKELVSERHRHRYEVSPHYIKEIENSGLVFSGTSPDGRLMEIAELPQSEHPFFLGTQFHPEFKARPLHPHPLFSAFIKAAITCAKPVPTKFTPEIAKKETLSKLPTATTVAKSSLK